MYVPGRIFVLGRVCGGRDMSKDAVKGSADRLETRLYRRSEQGASSVSYVSVLDGIQQVSEGDSGDRDSRRDILMDRW